MTRAGLLSLAIVLFTASGVVGCGGGTQAPKNAVAQASQDLQGSWRLTHFAPTTPLEAPLQGLLSLQLGTLTITFNQGQYSVLGPGVTVNGRYEVTGVEDDSVAAVLYDADGVGYHVTGQFSQRFLNFRVLDPPWQGSGTLERSSG